MFNFMMKALLKAKMKGQVPEAEQEKLFQPALLDSSYRILGQVVEVRKVHSLSFSGHH